MYLYIYIYIYVYVSVDVYLCLCLSVSLCLFASHASLSFGVDSFELQPQHLRWSCMLVVAAFNGAKTKSAFATIRSECRRDGEHLVNAHPRGSQSASAKDWQLVSVQTNACKRHHRQSGHGILATSNAAVSEIESNWHIQCHDHSSSIAHV